MQLAEAFGGALELATEVGLAGVVGAVRQPDGESRSSRARRRGRRPRGCARAPACARRDRSAQASRTCRTRRTRSSKGCPGRCSSSSRRSRCRARRRRRAARRGRRGRPTARGGSRCAFAPVSACSAAMSSSFSSVVRGSPPRGKRPKRVPPVPSAHDGAATENRWTSAITDSASTPRSASRTRSASRSRSCAAEADASRSRICSGVMRTAMAVPISAGRRR